MNQFEWERYSKAVRNLFNAIRRENYLRELLWKNWRKRPSQNREIFPWLR